ncbi:MAG: hypothetical protein K0S97_1047 [Chloroflexota bacterium]|nr:hypothetical protein [Chloroflexota bacterium]
MADPMGHAGHDPLLVAEAADRGARLAPVLDLCARCVGLYVDLVAVTASLPTSAVPLRPRSFTLTPDDVRRLRPPGWRAWWSAVGSARDNLTRPLAVGLTTLGLAGLLLTAAPTLLLGMGSTAGSAAPSEVAHRAASSEPAGRAPALMGDTTNREATIGADTGPSPTVTLSVGLLVVGGGLFVARRLAVHGRPMR